MASQYYYRLRAPKGLDATLIKDLRWQLKLNSNKETKEFIREIPGRKAIEVRGDQEMMWKLLTSSRITEDIQIKISKRSFLARGEKELMTGFQKLPWHAYMPSDDSSKFTMPKVDCKSH